MDVSTKTSQHFGKISCLKTRNLRNIEILSIFPQNFPHILEKRYYTLIYFSKAWKNEISREKISKFETMVSGS